MTFDHVEVGAGQHPGYPHSLTVVHAAVEQPLQRPVGYHPEHVACLQCPGQIPGGPQREPVMARLVLVLYIVVYERAIVDVLEGDRGRQCAAGGAADGLAAEKAKCGAKRLALGGLAGIAVHVHPAHVVAQHVVYGNVAARQTGAQGVVYIGPVPLEHRRELVGARVGGSDGAGHINVSNCGLPSTVGHRKTGRTSEMY